MIQTSLSAPMRAVNGTVTPSWLPLPLIMAITSCNPCSSGCWMRAGLQSLVYRAKGSALGQRTLPLQIHCPSWGGGSVPTSHVEVHRSLWSDHHATSHPQARHPGGKESSHSPVTSMHLRSERSPGAQPGPQLRCSVRWFSLTD